MKAILAVAVLAMAAFAGVMIVGDDADAADPVTITYMVGGESSTRTMTGVTFVAPSPADIGFDIGDKVFENWVAGDKLSIALASGAVYRAGMEYAVPSESIKLWAVFDDNIYVTLVVGDESFKCPVKHIEAQGAVEAQGTEGQPGYVPARDAIPEKYIIDVGSEQYKAAEAAVKAIDLNKFRLNGWFVKDATSAKYADLAKIVAATDLDESITLSLKTTAYFQVSFVVEDVNIITLASDKLADEAGKYIIPVAPTKENHMFTAWVDKDGKDVITYTVDGGYKPVASELEFTENTVLYAAFTPDNMTVTFQIGEKTVTQTVLYGAKAMKPELPAGYVAWIYDGKEFDFNNTPITENITIVALEAGPVEPTTIYDITFEIADKTPVVQKSDSMVIPDTTLEGYIFQGWVVKNGSQYVDPVEYVKTITENVTFVAVYKLATESAFTVTFEIEGKSAITQKADSLAIPDTTREGYDFTGWVVKGSSDYVDPMTYSITADITFVAVYKAVEVVKYTVTFINGDDVAAIEVIAGELVDAPEAPEGMFWLYDADAPVTADMTVYAKPLTVTVQFAVGEKVYNAYTQTIAYGEKIDVAKLADFIFPAGFDSWNYDFNEPVTADMTVYAKAIPEPEKEPKFYETPLGQCAIVIVVFLVGLLGFGLATGRVSVPDLKSSLGKNKGAKKP